MLKFTVEKALYALGMTAEVIPGGAAGGIENADLYVMPFGLNPQRRLGEKTNYIVVRNVADADEVIAHLKNCTWLK